MESTDSFFETVCDFDGQILCYVSKQTSSMPEKTTFVTNDETNPQIGFIVYPKGHEVQPHSHIPVHREVIGTPETLIIRRGRVTAHIYSKKQNLIKNVELTTGDVCILVAGGHGFTIEEDDTVMLEVKQGPYAKGNDKVYFEPQE